MDLYSKALIEAARDARQQAQELRRLGRRLRDESNQYRQASYYLGDLIRARQKRLRSFPTPKPQPQQERSSDASSNDVS